MQMIGSSEMSIVKAAILKLRLIKRRYHWIKNNIFLVKANTEPKLVNNLVNKFIYCSVILIIKFYLFRKNHNDFIIH